MRLDGMLLKRVFLGGGVVALVVALVVGIAEVVVGSAPETELAVAFVLAVAFALATELESVLGVGVEFVLEPALASAPALGLALEPALESGPVDVEAALALTSPHFETALEPVPPALVLVTGQDSLAQETSPLHPSSSHSPKSPSAAQNAAQNAAQTRCWKRGVIARSQSPSSLNSFQINSPSAKLRDSQD